jgi:SAM-dependent methyltransferase
MRPWPTDTPSDTLLRTLASVPVSTPILNLGCGPGHHAEALLRLGFPMHATDPRPQAVEATRAVVRELVDEETAHSCVRKASLQELDTLEATFDWIIADRTEAYLDTPADLDALLAHARSLLAPGGWLYLTVPARPPADDGEAERPGEGFDDVANLFAPADLQTSTTNNNFLESQSPDRVHEHGEARLHGLYRRVTPTAPV